MIPSNLCPFVKSPFDECYVATMNGTSIADAVYYCGGNFRECPIYKMHPQPVPSTATRVTSEIVSTTREDKNHEF